MNHCLTTLKFILRWINFHYILSYYFEYFKLTICEGFHKTFSDVLPYGH